MSVSATSPTPSASTAAAPSPVYNPVEALVPVLPSENAETARAAGQIGDNGLPMFADGDDPSFGDLLDVINPLQHIPFVSDIYREETGDKIGVGARLVGGALFGGPLGLIGAAVNCVMEESTGATAGGHVLALFKDDSPAAGDTKLAGTKPAATVASAAGDNGTAETATGTTAATSAAAGSGSGSGSAAATGSGDRGRLALLDNLIGNETVAPAAAPRATVTTTPITAPTRVAQSDTTTSPAAATVSDAANPTRLTPEASTRPLKMPMRTVPIATRDPPRITGSLSSSGAHSALPITGQRPQTGLVAPSSAGSMVAAQSEAGATTPVTGGPSLTVTTEAAKTTPPTSRTVTDPRAATAAPAGNNDWFAAAMSNGIDKYERSTGRKLQADPNAIGGATAAP
ncbi:MAG: hypothetical protein RLZZ501_2176 [Pseudomonadota bacterium]|jgi:hypothetical protein